MDPHLKDKYYSGLLAAASLLSTMDRTPKAAKRCSAWMDRTLVDLRTFNDPVQAAGAIGLLDRVCRTCKLCEGRTRQ